MSPRKIISMNGKYKGTVAHWIPARKFGFVFSDAIGHRTFFHIAAWGRLSDPVIGEQVTFNLKASAIAGQPDKAVDVAPINAGGTSALAGGAR